MTVAIRNGTGATPTWADVGATTAKFNRVDTLTGTTAIPTPTATGTNFSYIKTFQINITATGSLSMTNAKVEKVTSEATTGTKLWHYTGHAVGVYVQATAAPTATGDNNSTAPTLNSGTATAMPALGAGSTYAAGAYSTTGGQGNLVEVALGVDATNTSAGSAVSVPTLRWTWTEGANDVAPIDIGYHGDSRSLHHSGADERDSWQSPVGRGEWVDPN